MSSRREGGGCEGARAAPGAHLALLLLAVVVGSAWRLAPVPGAFLFGDELHSLRDLPRGYGFLASHFSPTGSGLALPLLQRALADLFGTGPWSLRLPAYAAGIALIPALVPVGRRMVGASAATVAALLVAGNGLLIFYSHFARSYALMCLLALLLLGFLQRVVNAERAGPGAWVGAGLFAGLLPGVQPVALGFVLPAYAGALLALRLEGGRRRDAGGLSLSLGAALIAAVLLHVPAWDSLVHFVADKTGSSYYGDFGPWDVAALLAGSRPAAAVAGLLLAVGLPLLWKRRGPRSLPLIFALSGPPLALAVLRPFGDPYAYARYLSPCIPCAGLVLGATAWELLRPLRVPRRRELATLGVGVVLAALQWIAGPTGPRHTPDGPYANTYLSLQPLPPFDRPWPDAPAFYGQLAARADPVRILEVPALTSRTRHLYRNHYLRHRMDTWLGFVPAELATVPDGPYVSLADPSDPAWRRASGADYLVLHRDIEGEVEAYWRFVYAPGGGADAPEIAASMRRHSRYELPRAADYAAVRAALGPELYRDRWISVWDLADPAAARP